MADFQNNADELQCLVMASLNGVISAADAARLDDLLREDIETQRRYLALVNLDSDLHFIIAQERATRIDAQMFSPAPASRAPASNRNEASFAQWLDYTRYPLAFSVGIGVLTVVALMLTAWQFPMGAADKGEQTLAAGAPSAPAYLTDASDAVWGNGQGPSFAAPALAAGRRFTLLAGYSEVTFASGAVAVVQAPAAFVCESNLRLRLLSGQIVVTADHGAHGFMVDTPVARVVDLGTEFGVRIEDSQKAVHVQVQRGKVSVTPIVAPGAPAVAAETLHAGEALQVARASETEAPRLARAAFEADFARRSTRPEFNVALGRPIVAASGSWQYSAGLGSPDSRYIPQLAVDGRTKDETGAFWLGFEGRADEFFVIDLQKLRRIQRVELLNTHNAEYENRGTKDCEIWISTEILNGELIEPKLLCQTTLPDVRGSGPNVPVQTLEVWSPESNAAPPEARFVKFLAKNFYAAGSGLNEIRVFGAPAGQSSPEAAPQLAAGEQAARQGRTAAPAEDYGDYLLSLKPSAYYRMQENEDLTLVDSSPAQRHGVVQFGPKGLIAENEPAWRPGRFGTELYSAGIMSPVYALAPYAPADTNQLSVAAWVKAENWNTWGIIAANWAEGLGGQFHFGLQGNQGDVKITVRQRNGTAIGVGEGPAGRLRRGVWEHVVFTANGVRLQLYRNGRYIGYARCIGVARPTLPVLSLGCITNREGTAAPPPDAAWYWQGSLDEVAVFDRALSPEEIERIYRLSCEAPR